MKVSWMKLSAVFKCFWMKVFLDESFSGRKCFFGWVFFSIWMKVYLTVQVFRSSGLCGQGSRFREEEEEEAPSQWSGGPEHPPCPLSLRAREGRRGGAPHRLDIRGRGRGAGPGEGRGAGPANA